MKNRGWLPVLLAGLLFCACGSVQTEQMESSAAESSVQGEQTEPSAAQAFSAAEHSQIQREIQVSADETITVSGMVSANSSDVFPSYCLMLEESLSVMLADGELTEHFVCDTLYFYDEAELNGGYAFAELIHQPCTVTAGLENYRGAGKLYLLNPTIMVDESEAEKTTTVPSAESLTAEFYTELCNYVLSSCVNYTEWWSNATFSVTDPTYYFLGRITRENYDENMQKAKQMVDGVYRTGYWEIRERGRGTLQIGLYLSPENELYFCYRY